MNPGDLKNTFIDKNGVEQTVIIPAEIFRQARREKITNKYAIQRYLAEQGYLDKPSAEEATPAKQSRVRTRKPNDTKRRIIDLLSAVVTEQLGTVEVTNPERQFRFEIDGNVYEVTLVQKRPSK